MIDFNAISIKKEERVMKKMLIVDGNSILNRAYYGIRPLTNKAGLYTHAVYGMINIISRYFDSVSPDYCVVAFDLKAPTFRHKMYGEYKANRKGMPEELAVQLPYAKKAMQAFGYFVLTKEGYEADDILGTLSASAASCGVKAYILTGDRDSLQLIGDNVSVLLVKTKETIEFDRAVFFENYGIGPEQFVDVKALMGDTSDNIPGVAGIGEKTALKLISDFGSLDGLYEKYADAKLSDSVKQKLENGREMAYISRDLALIDRDAPISKNIEDYAYCGAIKQELKALFEELEFFAFIKRFGLENVEAAAEPQDVAEHETKQAENIDVDAASHAFAGKSVAVFKDGNALSLFDGERVLTLDTEQGLSAKAKALLEGALIICHDYKQLYKDLKALGVDVGECGFDTMLAAYVLNSGRSKYGFDEVVSVYGASGSGVEALYSLYVILSAQIEEQECHSLLYDIEIPLARVLADMELVGFKIDVDGIIGYGEELAMTAEAVKTRIYMLAGQEFNINSPKQLGEVLFEKMGLPASKKTKTGYSTDAETLQKLLPKHEIIGEILEYRHLVKLKSTYADGLAKAADADGRIHSAFNQTGTATGRLSSAEPNLQNIPVRTELGRRFRKYFIPATEDYVLLDADYSQIELRLLAHIAGDDTMRDAFINGNDIHAATAATVFGVDIESVTPDLRKRAKAVNFGIVYGIGEYSLSEDLGIAVAEAKRYIQSYLASFPRISEYLENIKKKAREDGYVVTEFGRKRYIPELSASNKNVQHFGERVAMNSPIQGTAADVIKIAMIEVAKELKNSGIDARLILQVHDELLIESHASCAEQAREILVRCMENAVKFTVPLDVEANVGRNWYEAK